LLNKKTVSSDILAFLWLAVENGASILIAGGVGTGKTTMLNSLLMFVPAESKIISIEDTRELNLPHENWIASISRPSFGGAGGAGGGCNQPGEDAEPGKPGNSPSQSNTGIGQTQARESLCNDDFDNDVDGLLNMKDPDCYNIEADIKITEERLANAVQKEKEQSEQLEVIAANIEREKGRLEELKTQEAGQNESLQVVLQEPPEL
jgi:energy-coupling factor transporter ATP-binding protein EcfA2